VRALRDIHELVFQQKDNAVLFEVPSVVDCEVVALI
jgi:hypothetical protein